MKAFYWERIKILYSDFILCNFIFSDGNISLAKIDITKRSANIKNNTLTTSIPEKLRPVKPISPVTTASIKNKGLYFLIINFIVSTSTNLVTDKS